MALDKSEHCQGTRSDEEKSKPDEESIEDATEVKDIVEFSNSNTTGPVLQIDAQNNNKTDVGENRFTIDEQRNLNLETLEISKNESLTDAGDGTDYIDSKNEQGEKSAKYSKESGLTKSLSKEDISDTVAEVGIKNEIPILNEAGDTKWCGEIKASETAFTENEVKDYKILINKQPQKTEINKLDTAKVDVTKLKKTHLSFFLPNSYYDENSILKYGSIDVADDAHIELEILHEKTKGKSWNEELNETIEALTGEKERAFGDANGNTPEEIKENEEQIVSCHTTNENLVLTEGLFNEIKSDPNTEEKSHEDSVLELSFKTRNTVKQENTYIEESGSSIEKFFIANNFGADEEVDTKLKENVERAECFKEIVGELDEISCDSNNYTANSDYDADSSDSEAEQIERTNEVKAALLSCLKGRCETLENADTNIAIESDTTEQVNFEQAKTINISENGISEICTGVESNVVSQCKVSDQITYQAAVDRHSGFTLSMPETRDNIDGSISPSLMFASCRYRWEKTILTRAQNVVFVTLNKKEIEPVQLEWSESSRCFYSEEVKVPVGVYIGNLVIDGTFYPVEDIAVKHYTFEVDLYLKDDILEDEGHSSGVTEADELSTQKKQGKDRGQRPDYHSKDYSHTSDRDLSYSYHSTRAKMEEEQVKQTPIEGNINVTSKYEELVRSQMNQNKSALNDNDFESSMLSKSNFSDLEGRRTPVGEDGEKQYQDSDITGVKKTEWQQNVENNLNNQNISKHSPSIEDFFEQRSTHSNGSISNGFDALEGKTSPAVIDDVLGNGHTRTPRYSTESPVYSKQSSANSSARQTPAVMEVEQMRPASVDSVGSVRSANSLSKHVLDDLVSDALGWPRVERTSPSEQGGSKTAYTPTRMESVVSAHSDHSASRRAINDLIEDSLTVTRTPPPSKENSVQGSSPETPPPQEQIDDVLNPADRHSPIRREFLAGSPSLFDSSAKGLRSGQSSAHGSQRQTPQRQIISNSLNASQEKLYSSQSSGSYASSRPQSLTSEQELTQYYENLTDSKSGSNTEIVETNVLHTGGTSSLPAISSQQRCTPDKRSMTPDNHIRVPMVSAVTKTSLLPSRTPPRTPLSNASSRTVTPVNTDPNAELRFKEQMKDLENTISNLRKLLTSREQEILELKNQFSEVRGINEKLQCDLDRHRARASQGPQIAELERKVREAHTERESLHDEISLLKEELQKQKEPGLNSYNPNSSAALQRKIDELNGQIQDLHEAHEAASEEMQAAERKVKQLAAENETLRVTQSESQRNVEDENRHLKLEVQRLCGGHGEATDYRLKIELQQIKADNRNLRERNYQLHDDNIRLKEELSNLRKPFEVMDRKVQLKDERVRQYDDYGRNDTDRAMKSRYPNDLSEPNRLTDREWVSYTMSRSSYDVQGSEPIRDDYKEDRLTKSESMRYDRLRTRPDGGSSDKLRSSVGYSQSFTQELPRSLEPLKRDSTLASKSQEKTDLTSMTVDRSDFNLSRARGERSRTRSAEIDFRSIPLAAYHGDFSSTTPALTGRSRAIYKEISDLRSRSKAHLEDEEKKSSHCESGESNPETENSNNQSNQNNKALSSKVFMNRFVQQNPVSEVEQTNTDTRRLHLAEKVDSSYARREANVTHQRETLEKQVEMLEKQAEKQSLLSSLPMKSGYCDDGNMSDTPTDILVNFTPVEKIPSSLWSTGRQRRGSVGSDISNSSFSDIDEQITASVRKRSKSADGREVLKRMGPTGSTSKENLTLSRTLSPAASAGLRTVTPRPIATQHNKSALSVCSSLNSLTQGLRPFAPRSAQDLQIKDVIKFSRQGGKLSQGTIRFIGHLPGRGDIYLGVELDKEDGKHDGVFEGIRYFKCKPSKGVFVAYNKVVMAWTSY